ncbi:MAG: zinc ribbon domain-containing protein, partial [Chloroflexota bacterium]
MIVCPVCNHRNPDAAPTCAACGAALVQVGYRECPSCEALNPADSLFCSRCLAELAPEALDGATETGEAGAAEATAPAGTLSEE